MSSGISNAVGDFHQEVLGSVEGFRNHDAGYDLECPDKQIVAEVKNKHNTMNAPNRKQVVDDLDTAVRQKTGSWVAYLVVIVPGKPKRYRKKLTNRVYEIDGASFFLVDSPFLSLQVSGCKVPAWHIPYTTSQIVLPIMFRSEALQTEKTDIQSGVS